jgi:hypothetical protein
MEVAQTSEHTRLPALKASQPPGVKLLRTRRKPQNRPSSLTSYVSSDRGFSADGRSEMASSDPPRITAGSARSDEAGCELSAPRAYRIPEVCKIIGLGRTSVYAAIKSGGLVARKWNRCTIVLAEDLEKFLNNLPKAG